jgi:hypothetical protein
MSIRSVLKEAIGTYIRRWWELVPRAFVVYLVLSLGALAAARILGGLVGLGAAVLTTVVGYAWLQALHVLESAEAVEGRTAEPSQTFARALGRVLPLLGASLVSTVLTTVGLLLLVVPGIVFIVWASMLVPAVVLEGHGPIAGLRRSRELVRGHGGKVLATTTIVLLLIIPAAAVLKALIGFVFPASPETASFVEELVVDPVTAPLAVLAFTSMYFRLREAKAIADAPAEAALAAA